ncbi:MAG: haloacid dehalogenase type II [Anaeromyxobacteraceae bacterium]
MPQIPGLRAALFDAYGTLFDVASAASAARDALGERWERVAEVWRSKQLQYTWLRSLEGRHADFAAVTADALDFALEAVGVARDAALRARLLDLYERLAAYPDARDALARARAAGLRTGILSNGTPAMLAAAVQSAGLADLLDAVISIEEVGIYKPHPSVYAHGAKRIGAAPAEILFVSSNGWDADGAKAFGYRVVWCNRAGAPQERLPHAPDAVVTTLADVTGLVR